MNTTDLKLTIIRQVETLEEETLIEVLDYIQSKIGDSKTSVLDSLSEAQKQGIQQAQQSIQDGKGIPHNDIVARYKSMYGVS